MSLLLKKKQNTYQAVAFLKGYFSSPRKTRLIVNCIRNKNINIALSFLRYSNKKASKIIEKLLISCISNWRMKYSDNLHDYHLLYIKRIFVNNGPFLKRLRPAPQGRAHRIRKRSSHIKIFIDIRK